MNWGPVVPEPFVEHPLPGGRGGAESSKCLIPILFPLSPTPDPLSQILDPYLEAGTQRGRRRAAPPGAGRRRGGRRRRRGRGARTEAREAPSVRPGVEAAGRSLPGCVEPPPAPHRPRPQPRGVPAVEKLWSGAIHLHHPSHSAALARGLQGRKRLLGWQQGQCSFFPCQSLGRSSFGSREGGGEQRCAFQSVKFYMKHVGRGASPACFRVGGSSMTQCTAQAEHASY